MSRNHCESITLLEYRPDPPAITWRDPFLAFVPFTVGAAVGGAAGIMPFPHYYYDDLPRNALFLISLLGGLFVFGLASAFIGLSLAIRCNLSRDMLSARSEKTCFILGLCVGAISFPAAFCIAKLCNMPLELNFYLLVFPPSVASIAAAWLVLRRLYIKPTLSQ